MGFLSRIFGQESKREGSVEDKQSRLDLPQLTALLDSRLEKSQSHALEKTGSTVKEILQEKAVAQGIVERIKEVDFDDDIKDRTYKPIITSKPIYVRGMLEGLKGIKDATPQDFEELSTFHDRVAKSLKTIQTVQHKKGRYMSFAFQKEMLSLGSHLNRMIDTTARVEEELSKVEKVSEENREITDDAALLKAEIRRIEERSEEAQKQGRRARELEEETATLEQKLSELKDSEEYRKQLELEAGLEGAEKGLCELDNRVHSLVSPLKRPFRKYEKFLEAGGVGVGKNFLKKLREYQASPKQAFSTEEPSNVILQDILSGLTAAITKGDLKLSETEKKKTLHRIGQLEGGVIAELQTQRRSLLERVRGLKDTLSQRDVKVRIEELSARLESLKKARDEARNVDMQNPKTEIEIDDLKGTIELKATKLLGMTVELVIPELENLKNR